MKSEKALNKSKLNKVNFTINNKRFSLKNTDTKTPFNFQIDTIITSVNNANNKPIGNSLLIKWTLPTIFHFQRYCITEPPPKTKNHEKTLHHYGIVFV